MSFTENFLKDVQVVGLIGAPKAGKDTIADFLVNKGFVKFAVADEIKKGYYAETGYTEEQFKLARGTELEQKIRDGLWNFSARKCKELENPCYFMYLVIEAIKNSGAKRVVISDVRTQMEYTYFLRFAGAQMILILRDYKKELNSELLAGTKIYLKNVIHLPKFWNTFDTLDEAHEELERFYGNVILGGNMNSDIKDEEPLES